MRETVCNRYYPCCCPGVFRWINSLPFTGRAQVASPGDVLSVQRDPWELQAAHQVYSVTGTETDGTAATAGRAKHLVHVLI